MARAILSTLLLVHALRAFAQPVPDDTAKNVNTRSSSRVSGSVDSLGAQPSDDADKNYWIYKRALRPSMIYVTLHATPTPTMALEPTPDIAETDPVKHEPRMALKALEDATEIDTPQLSMKPEDFIAKPFIVEPVDFVPLYVEESDVKPITSLKINSRDGHLPEDRTSLEQNPVDAPSVDFIGGAPYYLPSVEELGYGPVKIDTQTTPLLGNYSPKKALSDPVARDDHVAPSDDMDRRISEIDAVSGPSWAEKASVKDEPVRPRKPVKARKPFKAIEFTPPVHLPKLHPLFNPETGLWTPETKAVHAAPSDDINRRSLEPAAAASKMDPETLGNIIRVEFDPRVLPDISKVESIRTIKNVELDEPVRRDSQGSLDASRQTH